MEISIGKLKNVIEELRDAEVSYKMQIYAFDKVLHGYQPLDKEGRDKRTMKRISEKLQEEYRQIQDLRTTLMEIVKCYETAEKNIIGHGTDASGTSSVFKKIDIGYVQRILQRYNITLT